MKKIVSLFAVAAFSIGLMAVGAGCECCNMCGKKTCEKPSCKSSCNTCSKCGKSMSSCTCKKATCPK